MKGLLYLAMAMVVMGLAFWAYRENYRTQSAINEMGEVQNEIAALREELGVLRAEWAYLNRPDRLSELVNLNFETLKLVPMTSDQFLDGANIAYPPPPPPHPPRRPADFVPPDSDQITEADPTTEETQQ